MTRNQTPPPPPSNDPVAPNPDPSDLESRMARLVGLEEEPPSSDENSTTLRQPPITEPQDVQTLAPLSSNPFAKAGLVGAGTLAVVVVAGVFLSQLMSSNNKPKKIVETPKAVVQPTIDPRLQQQAEVETLKTKLALAEQANDVKAAQQELRREKPKVVVKPTPTVRPAVVPQRIPTPPTIRTVYVPRIVTVNPVVKAPPVLPVKTIPTPAPVVTPTVQPTVATTPAPPPDPLQTWARLAKLGSYGQVSNVATQPVNVSSPTLPRGGTIALQRPAANTSPAIPVASQVTQTPRTSKSVKVGTRVKGVLDTGIFGESTNSPNNFSRNNNKNDNQSSSNNNELFKVRLTEALKAQDGSIAVPANATLYTKIRSISDKGLVQLDVVKFTWQENGNLTERSVSPDTLSVRGPKSQPLVATQYQSGGGGSRFASDAQLFALGGVGKIGQVLNLPEQKIIPNEPTTSPGNNGTTIVNNNTPTILTTPQRNILPAILEGGERAVTPELTRRIQQKNSRNIQEKSNIWYLSAGKSIELFFNQDWNS
ncbi:MAG: hypothetical protein DSM106950_14080 [Stigonema ocellatum SAG 48.90 = DSM 106950]|nr:hypothetical protein [Stigonema ocellatum SAG 48.90 = DSM 106950]